MGDKRNKKRNPLASTTSEVKMEEKKLKLYCMTALYGSTRKVRLSFGPPTFNVYSNMKCEKSLYVNVYVSILEHEYTEQLNLTTRITKERINISRNTTNSSFYRLIGMQTLLVDLVRALQISLLSND